MIQKKEFLGIGIKIYPPGEIIDIEPPHIMPDESEWNYQRNKSVTIMFNTVPNFSL